METNEIQELLKDAVVEIRSLRNQNQLMSARLEMFDTITLMLKSDSLHKGYGESKPDVVRALEKAHDMLTKTQ